MKKYLLYPMIVLAFSGICSSFLIDAPLKFREAFSDHIKEVILLALFLIIFTSSICYEVNSFMKKKKRKELQQLKKERDRYKKSFEELTKVDVEAQQLRAIIQYKKDNEDNEDRQSTEET